MLKKIFPVYKFYLEYNDTTVEYHSVTSPGENVHLECEDDDATLYKVHTDGTATMWSNPVFTVMRPSQQSKFMCVLEELVVTEVHYVMIEGVSVFTL